MDLAEPSILILKLCLIWDIQSPLQSKCTMSLLASSVTACRSFEHMVQETSK